MLLRNIFDSPVRSWVTAVVNALLEAFEKSAAKQHPANPSH